MIKNGEGEMECGQSGVRQEARKSSANYWIPGYISTAIFYLSFNILCIQSVIKLGLQRPVNIYHFFFILGTQKNQFSYKDSSKSILLGEMGKKVFIKCCCLSECCLI